MRPADVRGLVMQTAFEDATTTTTTAIPLPEPGSSGDELLRMGLPDLTGLEGAKRHTLAQAAE